jgi:hypothetical protein
MSGHVLYEGPSMLDGSPIVAIATDNSTNEKTGDMLQVWILQRDIEPHTAIKEKGGDSGICGICPQRQGAGCYVLPHQAPLSIFRAYKRRAYPLADHAIASVGRNRFVRLGAYGDPAALPPYVCAELISQAIGHTGYTHQLAHPRYDDSLSSMVMISADTPAIARKAHALGLRTFRPTHDVNARLPGEIVCPNEETGIQCRDCLLCDGKAGKPSVVVTIHGSRAKRFSGADLIAKEA